MQTLYTGESTAWGGRDGRVAASDGNLDLQLIPPKELGGAGGGTNPEQLLAAAWAGCFHSALKLVAKGQKVDVADSAVTVRISLVMEEAGGFGLAAELEAEMPGIDSDTAQSLLQTAHEVCPFSKALHTIDVKLSLVEN
jgi:osmotically inducible protein OsmC